MTTMSTMTRRTLLCLVVAAACGNADPTQKKAAPRVEGGAPTGPTGATGPTEVGYFAGGCFWGVEHFLEQMPGVVAVESGYMGDGNAGLHAGLPNHG